MKLFDCSKARLVLLVFAAAILLCSGSARADFTFGEATNLGPTVNTSQAEKTPDISGDGLSLYFGRPDGHGDIWVATRPTQNDPWDTPVNMGSPINSLNPDSAPSISIDGLSLYFVSRLPGSYTTHDIYVSTRQTTDDDWGAPVNLGPSVNIEGASNPDISADELSLFFASSRSGGYGDVDIWVTTRPTIDDDWGEPTNLGPIVNTSREDRDPSISADGLMLFFQSKRTPGYGNCDIWVSRRATTDDDWGEPVNIGPTVNSSHCEHSPSISADGSTLYFESSGRAEAVGNGWDIYQAPIIPICDFNGDGNLDTDDLLIMIENWKTDDSTCDIGPMPWGDGVVDRKDVEVWIKYWEQENFPEEPEE